MYLPLILSLTMIGDEMPEDLGQSLYSRQKSARFAPTLYTAENLQCNH